MSTSIYQKTIIYKSTYTFNGFCYIGATSNSLKTRKGAHESKARNGSNGLFQRSLREYGLKNFDWVILDETDDVDFAFQVLEKKYIRDCKSHYTERGYNMTWGGERNHQHEIPISKKELSKLYLENGLSTAEIGKKYGVWHNIVCNWLRIYDISIRPNWHSHKNKPDKKILEDLYLKDKLTTYKIAKNLGVSPLKLVKNMRLALLP